MASLRSIARIEPLRPGLLEQLERDVWQRLEQPAIWAARVPAFATLLAITAAALVAIWFLYWP